MNNTNNYFSDSKVWDVFISHAHEDKEAIARPLAEQLRQAGLKVWYDEFSLRVGDSLNESINRGLANSRYGVVILSPHFIIKKWTRAELNGLVGREELNKRIILPIWHEINAEDVKEFSPTLADIVSVHSSIGIEKVVNGLLQTIGDPGLPQARHGLWVGDTGRLRFSVSPSGQVAGDYDWNGSSWAGHIVGEKDAELIRFSWHWDFSPERGNGLFIDGIDGPYSGRSLRGGWAHDYDCVDVGDAETSLKHPKLHKWEFRFSRPSSLASTAANRLYEK